METKEQDLIKKYTRISKNLRALGILFLIAMIFKTPIGILAVPTYIISMIYSRKALSGLPDDERKVLKRIHGESKTVVIGVIIAFIIIIIGLLIS